MRPQTDRRQTEQRHCRAHAACLPLPDLGPIPNSVTKESEQLELISRVDEKDPITDQQSVCLRQCGLRFRGYVRYDPSQSNLRRG